MLEITRKLGLDLPHHRIIQEHRNPLPGSNPVFFRSPLQYQFSIQVIDQSCFTPRSNDLPLVFEWQEKSAEFSYAFNLSLGGHFGSPSQHLQSQRSGF